MLTKIIEAGRKISAANLQKLRMASDHTQHAIDHLSQSHSHLSDLVQGLGPDTTDSGGPQSNTTMSDMMAAEAERSYQQLMSLINEELQEQGYYLCDLYDDYAIAQSQDGKTYSLPWAVDAEGMVTLGEPTEVIVSYVPASDATGDGDDDGDDGVLAKPGVPTKESKRLTERDFTQDERDAAAKKGAAMPDGSFPILTAGDLKNAVQASGRAKDKAAVKAHIIKRAKALGATDQLPADWEGSTAKEAATNPLTGDVIPLVEKAVSGTGTIAVKVIQPGWGSSGYYSPSLLERDGPQAFTRGTKMYWDHPSLSEEKDRPERSLRDLAGELVSDARWQPNGPSGPGLYAEAKLFGDYKEAVEELAPHIGVSIRASGIANQGEADGRKGPIVERITAAHSVDFVTVPGAGGQILSLFEAARPQPKESTMDEVNQLKSDLARLREALALRDARDQAQRALARVPLHEATRVRLAQRLVEAAPITDGVLDSAAFAAQISEAVQAEQTYLSEIVGSGRVVGMGQTGPVEVKPEVIEQQIAESFQALGYSDELAKLMAVGRR